MILEENRYIYWLQERYIYNRSYNTTEYIRTMWNKKAAWKYIKNFLTGNMLILINILEVILKFHVVFLRALSLFFLRDRLKLSFCLLPFKHMFVLFCWCYYYMCHLTCTLLLLTYLKQMLIDKFYSIFSLFFLHLPLDNKILHFLPEFVTSCFYN